MSGNSSDCHSPPVRNGDGAGNNIGTAESDGSSTPGRAKRVGMKQTIHCRGCSPPYWKRFNLAAPLLCVTQHTGTQQSVWYRLFAVKHKLYVIDCT